MNAWRARAERHADPLIAAALFVAYLGLLLSTSGSLGFTRDEGFYFVAARQYGAWFELLGRDPAVALSREMIDRYWSVNHEHPSLIKSLFALSNRWLASFFSEVSTSFRFPAMLLSSAAVAAVFDWGRRSYGRAGGLVAALSFAFLPRVFFHAHLACFDLPVCAMWLLTSYVYARAFAEPRWGLLLAAGVMYGLLLDTKHNSWLFPGVLGLHFALTRGLVTLRELRRGLPFWKRIPPVWLSLLLLGPLVFYALWPWLWHDPLARFREYVAFHTGHEFYNMEFLGRTYWKPPMPRAYAWLMTLGTVPFITLALAVVGVVIAIRSHADEARFVDYSLWGVCLLVSYAPWWSADTPIFGGTKHWITAYPYLCLLAGLGFVKVCGAARELSSHLRPSLTAVAVLLGPAAMTLHAHPFGLSFYTPLVGGAPGAATLGLNRTFWGYTTQELAPFINQLTPARGTVYVHDTALQSFAMFKEDGRLRRDLRGSLNIAASDVALYHHEPHMSRVEHQIWIDYGTLAPAAIATFDGVPITWGYVRPRE